MVLQTALRRQRGPEVTTGAGEGPRGNHVTCSTPAPRTRLSHSSGPASAQRRRYQPDCRAARRAAMVLPARSREGLCAGQAETPSQQPSPRARRRGTPAPPSESRSAWPSWLARRPWLRAALLRSVRRGHGLPPADSGRQGPQVLRARPQAAAPRHQSGPAGAPAGHKLELAPRPPAAPQGAAPRLGTRPQRIPKRAASSSLSSLLTHPRLPPWRPALAARRPSASGCSRWPACARRWYRSCCTRWGRSSRPSHSRWRSSTSCCSPAWAWPPTLPRWRPPPAAC
jgi:hypothetical protein